MAMLTNAPRMSSAITVWKKRCSVVWFKAASRKLVSSALGPAAVCTTV